MLTGLPTFAWGLHSALVLVWAVPVPGRVPSWFGPWLTELISCLTSDPPCLYRLALIIMDLPGNPCGAGWSRLFSPALPCSLKDRLCWWGWCWGLPVTLGSLPFDEKPTPDRWVPRCFGNFISENSTTEYWNSNLLTEISADFVPCITKSLLKHDLP